MRITKFHSAAKPARLRRGGQLTRRLCVLICGGAMGCLVGTAAWAFFSAGGTGTAVVATGTLNVPTNTVANAALNSGTVAITWAGSGLATGQPAQGYYVTRIRTSDAATFPACGTSPSTLVTTVSCNDLGVTDGDYRYEVTAVFGSWTGLGAVSPTVTVVNDSSLPTITVTSISPTPNSNGYNSSSPVVVNLSATAGAGIASISYQVDAGPTTTVNSSTAAVTVTGEAVHAVTYSARDHLGNVSATDTVLVRIDTTAPAAPSAPVLTAASDSGSSQTDRVTNVTTPTVTGTAEAGATVTLYDGATTVGTAVATGGAFTLTSSALAGGVHTLTVRATDLAGNLGPASTGTNITVDTTAPAAPSAPVLTAASDSGSSQTDRITNVTTPTMTGTAEAGATITLYDGATTVGTAVATGGAYSATSSALAGGVHTLTVKATDLAGNRSAASTSTSVTIDVTAPGAPGIPALTAASDTGRSATDKNTKVTTPTVTGTATASTTVTLYDATTPVGSVTTATTSYSMTSTALSDGSHTLSAKATDLAGNTGAASTAITVVIDTVAPAAPSTPNLAASSDTGKSSTDDITKTTTPSLTGTNETKAIVTLYDAGTQVGAKTTAATSYTVVSATLSNGTHTLTATATDVAGNIGSASSGLPVTIDTVAPLAPSPPVLTAASDTGISNADGLTKTTKPTLTGTAENGITVGLYDGANATGTAVTVSGGAYSQVTATLAAGAHTLTAKPTDVAGNVGTVSTGTTITVDTTAPTVTINQAAGQLDPTTVPSISFTAAFSEPVYGLTGAGVTLSGTAAASTKTLTGGPTTYTVTVSGMTKSGTVTTTVPAGGTQDAAGNTNPASTSTDATVTYTDNVAPTVAFTSFVAGPGATAAVSGTAGFGPGDNATVTVVLCTSNSFPCSGGNTKATLTAAVNAGTGAWSITSGTLGTNPTLYARATQTDLTGNTGQSPVAGPISTS